MSMTAVALILGVLVAFMVKARWVRASGAVVCVLFGLVLSSTPRRPRRGLGARGRGRLDLVNVEGHVRP